MKLIAPALAEIKPTYYPRKERLVSLDVLKLYRGEDIICQSPEDIDPNQYLDEGEERVGNEAEAQGTSEADNGPYLEIPISPEVPGTIAVREGIYKRIQAEIQHKAKEVEAMAEEILDAPPAWNEVPDLMMETEYGRMIQEAAIKRKRDEVACGWRKQQREDDIRPEKHEHSPMVSQST